MYYKNIYYKILCVSQLPSAAKATRTLPKILLSETESSAVPKIQW